MRWPAKEVNTHSHITGVVNKWICPVLEQKNCPVLQSGFQAFPPSRRGRSAPFAGRRKSAAAEFEREVIREQTLAGLKAVRAWGREEGRKFALSKT